MVYVPADLSDETAIDGDGGDERDGVDERDTETLRRQIAGLTRTVEQLLTEGSGSRDDAPEVAGEIADSVLDEVVARIDDDDGEPAGTADDPGLRGFY